MKRLGLIGIIGLFVTSLWTSCQTDGEEQGIGRIRFDYSGFVKRFHRYTPQELQNDTAYVLESNEINPLEDSLSTILKALETAWEYDSLALQREKSLASILHADSNALQTLLRGAYDSNAEMKLELSDRPVAEDVAHLKFNLEAVRSLDKNKVTASGCKQESCRVWARINKQAQRLYLYVDGVMVDTFKVSTGDAKHQTPNMSVRAAGPIFKKYTSKKFPGGDYMGLGNMPYAVFFRGGFAIHGTTPGNFSKLGKPASHGCVRLHPDDAVIFNELVRTVGLSETWVTVE